MCVSNSLSLKSFHGVLAGNVHECLLKSSIGKVSIIPTIPVEIQAPTADKTILQTLPTYYTYLQGGGFSQYTPDDFTGDLKKFGLFQKDKLVPQPS
jgi:hypothetical protein